MKPKTMFVVCQNDFPLCVVKPGASEKAVRKAAGKFEARLNSKKCLGERWIYIHIKEVPFLSALELSKR